MHLHLFKFACIIMRSWEGCEATFSFVYRRRRSYVVWMPVTSSCVWLACIRTTREHLYIDRCGEKCNYEWMEWLNRFNIISKIQSFKLFCIMSLTRKFLSMTKQYLKKDWIKNQVLKILYNLESVNPDFNFCLPCHLTSPS